MRPWLLPLVVFALACGAFWSSVDGDFVALDDDRNFVHNAGFRGLGADQLAWMFSTGHMGHYQPLSWVTYGFDHARSGLDPRAFHRTSVWLHGLMALAVYLLARVLFGRTLPSLPGALRSLAAALAAVLFAVHPLRAESVAWITGRNDIVAGLGFVLAVTAWLRRDPATALHQPRPLRVVAAAGLALAALALGLLSVQPDGDALRWASLGPAGLALAVAALAGSVLLMPRALGCRDTRWYALTCLAMGLSLLGKAYALVLPAVLLTLDVWPLRRGTARTLGWLLVEKLPFAVLSAGAGALAVWAKSTAVDSMSSLSSHALPERLLQACFGLMFYVRKTLVPTHLSPMVDLPATLSVSEPRFLLSAVAVLALTLVLWRLRRRAPGALATWVVYGIVLAPMLGLTQVGAQLVADRYSYVASIPLALLAAGGWALWMDRRADDRTTARAIAIALLLASGVATWQQAAAWRSSETIFLRGIEATGSPRLMTNLAIAHLDQALLDPQHAREHRERALEISEHALMVARTRDLLAPEMLLHRGTILMNLGRNEDARQQLEEFLALEPDHVQGLINHGLTLERLGDFEAALEPLGRAVRRAPEAESAWRYLGLAWEGVGRPDDAREAYRRALQLAPGQPMAMDRLRELEGR